MSTCPFTIYPTACPCCGHQTLDGRGEYDICKICWWEDDGQDNDHAERSGGPNGRVSLTEARINYIRYGIYDPTRSDLRRLSDPPNPTLLQREFVLNDELATISEPEFNWQARVK